MSRADGDTKVCGTENSQNINTSNSNPHININNDNKPTDPMQMLAFDNMRKLDGVKNVMFVVIGVLLLNLCLSGYVAYEQRKESLSIRAQYDKLRSLNDEFNRTLENLKNIK